MWDCPCSRLNVLNLVVGLLPFKMRFAAQKEEKEGELTTTTLILLICPLRFINISFTNNVQSGPTAKTKELLLKT